MGLLLLFLALRLQCTADLAPSAGGPVPRPTPAAPVPYPAWDLVTRAPGGVLPATLTARPRGTAH